MNYSLKIFAAGILILCVGPTGCGRPSSVAVVTAPIPVTVSYPVKRSVSDYADFTSRTSAVQSVDVRSRVSGYLESIHFKEGALVKKGDLLFEIDPRPYQAQVAFATAQVAANEAMLKKAKADNARHKTLAAKSPGAVTQQDLDQYQAAEDQ